MPLHLAINGAVWGLQASHRLAPDARELMSELGAVPDQPAPTPEAMAELDLKCVNTVRSDPPFADRLKFVG